MNITIGGVEIAYDRQGSGEPLILVMGLGTPRIGWFHQFSHFSQNYDVVCFDNRGCGETVCASPWTMADMAADVGALADAFGFETFHLVGISLGGMVSQEFVLTSPERLRTLTLIATTPGGAEAVPLDAQFAEAMMITDPAQRVRRTVELTFGEKFRRENPEMMSLILNTTASGMPGLTVLGGEASGAGFFGQLAAVAMWMGNGGAAARLKEISTPTLVLHGEADLLLPVGNGRILARDIPGARSRFWPDAGHALNVEYADEVNAEIASHLRSAARV